MTKRFNSSITATESVPDVLIYIKGYMPRHRNSVKWGISVNQQLGLLSYRIFVFVIKSENSKKTHWAGKQTAYLLSHNKPKPFNDSHVQNLLKILKNMKQSISKF